MTTFTLQIFETKNTAYAMGIAVDGVFDARREAIKYSIYNHHVIVSHGQDWEEYEKGEKVSWSAPSGLK